MISFPLGYLYSSVTLIFLEKDLSFHIKYARPVNAKLTFHNRKKLLGRNASDLQKLLTFACYYVTWTYSILKILIIVHYVINCEMLKNLISFSNMYVLS